jgi:hypothetical protein
MVNYLEWSRPNIENILEENLAVDEVYHEFKETELLKIQR